jgi:hypothetical protein
MKPALISLLVALAGRGLYDLVLFVWKRHASPKLRWSRLSRLKSELEELESFAPEEELAASLRTLLLFVAVAVFCGSCAFILVGVHMGLMNHTPPFDETWANVLHDLALLFLPMAGIWESFSLIKRYWQMRWLVPSLRDRRKAKLKSDIQKAEQPLI